MLAVKLSVLVKHSAVAMTKRPWFESLSHKKQPPTSKRMQKSHEMSNSQGLTRMFQKKEPGKENCKVDRTGVMNIPGELFYFNTSSHGAVVKRTVKKERKKKKIGKLKTFFLS